MIRKKKATLQQSEVGTADFSRCDKFRYQLTRTRAAPPGPSKPGTVLWIMLNPSKATHIVMDPTVTRCWLRTKALGYNAMTVVNLFAIRSTLPELLYSHRRPIGPKNDKYIIGNAQLADIIVCAWGNHGNHLGRSREIMDLLELHRLKSRLRHLGLNKNGEPKHPLYVSFATKLQEFP